MATWRARNSMLTECGVEILNKVKAGIGTITVTRIVAGSGRVSESLLYSQTAISGVQKNLVISSKNTTESGSEIVCYLDNHDFTESYALHQIGIYVTHPDYVEEQLYYITQCDSSDYDSIPAWSDTPLTQGYSIFMEHGNSSSISITVDPQGMVSREALDAELATIMSKIGSVASNAVASNLMTVDANKQIIDSGVPITSLGFSSRNILHNWYLKSPIDTKNGYFIPKGTYYFATPSVSGTTKGSTTVAYPVLSMDDTSASFTDGTTTYYVPTDKVKQGYVGSLEGSVCFDRWFLKSIANEANGISAITKDVGGAKLSLAKNGGAFYQNIANTITPKMLYGLKYTLTVRVTSYSGGSSELYIDQGYKYDKVAITKTGFFSLTVIAQDGAPKFEVGIKNTHASNASELTLNGLKLEAGTWTTLKNDPPADLAEQLAICIQFDPNTDTYRGFPSLATTTNILAEASITE